MAETGLLPEIVLGPVLAGVGDSHPRVRYAALACVGQMTEDFAEWDGGAGDDDDDDNDDDASGSFQESFHEQVIFVSIADNQPATFQEIWVSATERAAIIPALSFYLIFQEILLTENWSFCRQLFRIPAHTPRMFVLCHLPIFCHICHMSSNFVLL